MRNKSKWHHYSGAKKSKHWNKHHPTSEHKIMAELAQSQQNDKMMEVTHMKQIQLQMQLYTAMDLVH